MSKNVAVLSDSEAPSARELRRQEKIRQIVQAATEVFLDVGFEAASMDTIVKKAGVSKATLYNYFESKDEIFLDVMRMQLVSLFEKFEMDPKNPGDLAEQLRRVGTAMLRDAELPTTISMFRIVAAGAERFPKLALQLFEESFDKAILSLASIIERELPSSGLTISDPEEAGEYFLDLLLGIAQLRVVYGTVPPMNDQAIKARTERALDFFYRTYR